MMLQRTLVAKLAVTAAAVAPGSSACSPGDDDDETVDDDDDDDAAQEAHDRQVCTDVFRDLLEGGCPAGLPPKIGYGFRPSVTRLEDAGPSICGGLGLLIDADAVADREWVGTEITQNSVCTVGCFAPYCGAGTDVCVAGRASGNVCVWYCSDEIDEPACRRSVMTCNGIDPEEVDPDDEACGLEPTGGG